MVSILENRRLAKILIWFLDVIKIILGDINKKFDVLIEGHNSLREQLERDREKNKKEHEELKNEMIWLRKDLNEHRNNTELHAVKKKKAS